MWISLFLVSFISATLWPMASEALFLYYINQHIELFVWLWLTATVANSFGSILMYELSLRSIDWWSHKHPKKKQDKLKRWQLILTKYGTSMLFFAWLPLVGDLLPVAAGLLKMNRIGCVVWIIIGKAARYGVIGGIIWLQ